jgi:thiol-disulfide isomerase/thioredoxin
MKTKIDPIRRGLSGGLLAALLALTTATHAADLPPLAHGMNAQTVKKMAPNLKLPDLDGQTHDLAALKGHVVLINFWATWCPPCRREMPSMERLVRKLQGTHFVALAVDVGEDADTIQAFTSQLETTPSFPILLDSRSKAMQAWKVAGLPTTYLIDKNGRIAYSAVGGREFDHPEIEQTVRDLLKR